MSMETVRTTIEDIAERIYAAIRDKDAARVEPFLADDFVYRTQDGREVARAEFLEGIAALPIELVSVTGAHHRLSVFGDVAVLTGVQHAEYRQEPAQGISTSAFTDVFQRRGDRWLLVLAYGVEMS
jgi:ketosteroid isomerase-like protein